MNHQDDLESLLRQQLIAGESLLWQGRPLASGLARRVKNVVKVGRICTIFAILWTAAALGMITLGFVMEPSAAPAGPANSANAAPMAPNPPPPARTSTPRSSRSDGIPISEAPIPLLAVFPLFGSVFIAVGVWVMKSGTREARRRIIYGVTPRRVITAELTSKGERKITSYVGTDLEFPEVYDPGDGSGDLYFARVTRESDSNMRVNGHRLPQHGLWGVADLARVRQLVELASRQ